MSDYDRLTNKVPVNPYRGLLHFYGDDTRQILAVATEV